MTFFSFHEAIAHKILSFWCEHMFTGRVTDQGRGQAYGRVSQVNKSWISTAPSTSNYKPLKVKDCFSLRRIRFLQGHWPAPFPSVPTLWDQGHPRWSDVSSSESIFRSFWGVRLFDAGCDVPVKYVFSSRSCVREERGHRGSEAPLLSRNRRRFNVVKIDKKVQRKCKRLIHGQGWNWTPDLLKKKETRSNVEFRGQGSPTPTP